MWEGAPRRLRRARAARRRRPVRSGRADDSRAAKIDWPAPLVAVVTKPVPMLVMYAWYVLPQFERLPLVLPAIEPCDAIVMVTSSRSSEVLLNAPRGDR